MGASGMAELWMNVNKPDSSVQGQGGLGLTGVNFSLWLSHSFLYYATSTIWPRCHHRNLKPLHLVLG